MQIEITSDYLASQGLSKTFPKRFWKKVRKSDACWIWAAAKDGKGYGIIGTNCGSRIIRAHRASWIIHFGPIPEGLCVLHHCDVRECIRPDHLFLGTLSDNSKDMVAKKRNFQNQGENNPRRKLTWDQVREIRFLNSIGIPQKELMKRFHISCGGMSDIVNNKRWIDHSISRDSIS